MAKQSVKIQFDPKQLKLVDPKKLKLDPNNRNKHPPEQIERLCKLIQAHGMRWPVIVSKQTGVVKAGEGRVLAAIKLGMKQVLVSYQEFDSSELEYAFGVSDNAVAAWAELDLSAINLDLGDLGPDLDIDLLGIKDFVLEPAEKYEAQCDEDEIPEKVEAKTKLGDIYKLGKHRLMCGDSTSIDAVEKLMDGQKSDITFTSPPYNVGKTPNGDKQKYLNDSDHRESDEYRNFLSSFTNNSLTVSEFCFVNIQSVSGNKVALIDYLYYMKSKYADTLIWDKMTAEPAMAKNVLNSRYEYVHVFSHKANRCIGKKEFRGTLENIFPLNSRKDKDHSNVHKATFPVSFAEYFVSNFSEKSVLDLFGGSGSTLIACEKTNRRCFMMELDPYYCDIIVARYEKFSGKKAKLL